MLKLIRGLAFIGFLIFAGLTIAVLVSHRRVLPTISDSLLCALCFLTWYLLPVFLQKMESTLSNTDRMRPLRMEDAALKLEVRRLKCLYDDSKERFAQKDKQFTKFFIVLSVVARCLVAWEQSKGKISAEEAFASLREELRRLNIEDAEREDM
jgi:hypothetical protein